MGDSREEILDLDLNLEPSVPLSPGLNPDLESLSSDIGYMEERIRELEAVTIRDRHRWRWWQGRLPHEPRNISMELILNPGREMGLQNGEGSVASEESTTAGIKACKVNARDLVAKALEKDEDAEKGSSCGASFFECNICLDVAKNPVLTCCGHLYCWSCLYRWIHIHSDTKECPVCKGEVTDKNITPIYGRDNDKNETDKEDESGVKIPPRPHAHRVESLRQIIHRAVQIEDSYLSQMISRIGSRIDVLRERSSTTQDLAGASETPDRPSTLANRILTARGGIRREGSGRYPFLEQNVIRPEQDIVDLTQGSTGSSEAEGSRRPSLRVLRSQSQRAASISQLSSYLNSAERLVQAYFHRRPFRRNHAPSPQVENRDSVSSITSAGIHSESQSRDSAIEIDSLMALLPSSSRRRTDASRASDVDSGVSRAPRRRRFN